MNEFNKIRNEKLKDMESRNYAVAFSSNWNVMCIGYLDLIIIKHLKHHDKYSTSIEMHNMFWIDSMYHENENWRGRDKFIIVWEKKFLSSWKCDYYFRVQSMKFNNCKSNKLFE